MKTFTVKEIAHILSVSKPTVQKAINLLNIQPDRIEKNKFRYYNQVDVIKIIQYIQSNFDFSGFAMLFDNNEKPKNIGDNTAKFCDKPPNLLPTPQTPPNNSELELLKNMLSVLQKQLEIKDKQIEEYQERLKEAMELTKGQQYISAIEKESKQNQEQEKKSIFQRLFHNKM